MSGNATTQRRLRLEGIGLSVGYGGTAVLDNVDLAIPSGEITILIGPNGCGKSTLLKAMARILTPTRGSVLLDGKDIHRLDTKSVAARLGLLPQGPIAPEGLSVRELVAQGRFPHQSLLRQWTRADEDAVNGAMAIAGITDFADAAGMAEKLQGRGCTTRFFPRFLIRRQ